MITWYSASYYSSKYRKARMKKKKPVKMSLQDFIVMPSAPPNSSALSSSSAPSKKALRSLSTQNIDLPPDNPSLWEHLPKHQFEKWAGIDTSKPVIKHSALLEPKKDIKHSNTYVAALRNRSASTNANSSWPELKTQRRADLSEAPSSLATNYQPVNCFLLSPVEHIR